MSNKEKIDEEGMKNLKNVLKAISVAVRPTTVEAAAMAAHEVNRAYCLLIGDFPQVPWDDAPEWQRSSAILGAEKILQEPGTTPEESHQCWLAQKEKDGWVYGEVKDVEKKTHPCILPYSELPDEQRVKSKLFGKTVRQFLFI
jgi:hypothetical protein